MTSHSQAEIKVAIEEMGDKIPAKAKAMFEEAALKIQEGIKPAEALGFTPAMIEEIYTYGYKQYQGGKYKEALKVFTFLRQIDISQYRFTFAIAACHQYAKEYSEAAANYILCTYIEQLNPVPHFHLYDCFIHLNQPLSAMRAINESLELADLDPRYASFKEKVLLEYKVAEQIVADYLKDFKNKSAAKNLQKDEKQGESL